MISNFVTFAKDLLVENDKPSYGCLMAMVSPELSGQFIDWSFDNIDPNDTMPNGHEDEPHVTVLYGFHEDVTHEEVFDIVRNCKPLKITLGKVTKFKHDDQDVLKIDIESQDLRDLNALIIKKFADRYSNNYPEYHPHMTLAYVKPGTAEDIDPEVFEGFEMVIDDLVYSYPEESKKVHIKLSEEPIEPVVKESTAQKHTYEVKDVFVNGKRYTGHVVTTSEGSALAKVVFRNLSKDQQNNPQPHILTAKQIGGYKIIDRGVFTPYQKPFIPPYLEDSVQKIILPDNIAKAFNELAEDQREAPETAMLKASSLCSGVYGFALEHVGDLTHRMAQQPNFYQGGEEWVSEKLRKVLSLMTNPYGFEKEFKENLVSNYKYREDNFQTFDAYVNTVNVLSKQYAAEHKKLTVYNEAQWLAREAAIALGEQRFTSTIVYLKTLQNHLTNWSEFALQYKINSSGNPLLYQPGTK